MSWAGLVAAMAALATLEAALIVALLRQHGRVLVRHDRLGERLAGLEQAVSALAAAIGPGPHPGNGAGQSASLPVGAPAPDFELPSIDGAPTRLADLLPSAPVVVFFDPQCGFCQAMAPAIGQLDADRVVLISRGTAEANRALTKEHGWKCRLLLETGWEVASAYGTRATPTGYVIDGSGRIASPLLVGADALLEAATAPRASGASAQKPEGNGRTPHGRGAAAGLAVKDLTHSHIKRDGLPAGTAAPDFALPDVNNRTRSFAEFRGKRTLLIFSDPDCGPCQQLSARLAEFDRKAGGDRPQLVMVSRGDQHANRQKAREYGIAFPVLVQPGWSVSRKYAIFATPVGYLISSEGVIEKPVGIGEDAILELLSV